MIESILLGIIVLTIIGALAIGLIEASSGYLGDFSMVPGCLLIGGVLVLIVIALAIFSGRIVFQ